MYLRSGSGRGLGVVTGSVLVGVTGLVVPTIVIPSILFQISSQLEFVEAMARVTPPPLTRPLIVVVAFVFVIEIHLRQIVAAPHGRWRRCRCHILPFPISL